MVAFVRLFGCWMSRFGVQYSLQVRCLDTRGGIYVVLRNSAMLFIEINYALHSVFGSCRTLFNDTRFAIKNITRLTTS
jgi:hypothetical protein